MENLIKFAKIMLEGARINLTRDGEVTPALFFDGKSGYGAVAIPQFAEFRGPARDAMRDVLKKHGAERYAFICEAWVGQKKREDFKPGYVPSEDPERQEAITVAAADNKGNKLTMMCIFARDAGHIVFSEPDIMPGNGGPLLELLDTPATKH